MHGDSRTVTYRELADLGIGMEVAVVHFQRSLSASACGHSRILGQEVAQRLNGQGQTAAVTSEQIYLLYMALRSPPDKIGSRVARACRTMSRAALTLKWKMMRISDSLS